MRSGHVSVVAQIGSGGMCRWGLKCVIQPVAGGVSAERFLVGCALSRSVMDQHRVVRFAAVFYGQLPMTTDA